MRWSGAQSGFGCVQSRTTLYFCTWPKILLIFTTHHNLSVPAYQSLFMAYFYVNLVYFWDSSFRQVWPLNEGERTWDGDILETWCYFSKQKVFVKKRMEFYCWQYFPSFGYNILLFRQNKLWDGEFIWKHKCKYISVHVKYITSSQKSFILLVHERCMPGVKSDSRVLRLQPDRHVMPLEYGISRLYFLIESCMDRSWKWNELHMLLSYLIHIKHIY